MSTSEFTNATLIRSLRDELGWTQERLAAEAGLSVRVVAKAEAIATAFRAHGQAVTAADLLTDPATMACQFLSNYAKYQADCVQHSLDLLSPDIVAYVAGDPATNLIAGEYRGIEEFDRLWKKFFGLFVRDGGTIDNPELHVDGNNVVAWGYEHIRVPDVPPQKAGFVMLRMRFDGGKMIRFEDHYEASGMMRALKQWAKEYPNAEWLKQIEREALAAWSTDENPPSNSDFEN